MSKHGKELRPVERRAIVEKLLKGVSPHSLAEDNDISHVTANYIMRQWKHLLRLKRYFHGDDLEQDSLF